MNQAIAASDTFQVNWHKGVHYYFKFYVLSASDWKENFLKDESTAEVGTTRASINNTGKTNAKKGADDYNSYKEFHERENEGHVAAFMVHCGVQSMFIIFITVLNFNIIFVFYLITEF